MIVSVSNQKGGTAKTTTAVTLGHKLAQEGKRVLIVDTDVQGHVATALGLEKQPGIEHLVGFFQGTKPDLLIANARPNLDVLPSDKSTAMAKTTLAGLSFRERILLEVLAELAYDVVVIDCAPSVDVLHLAALVAADWLIVPTKLDHLAVDGVKEVIRSLSALQRRQVAPQLLGVLPSFFDRRTNETTAQLKAIARTFGRLVLPPVPDDVRLREAPAYGQSIWEYAPDTRGVVGIEVSSGAYFGGYAQAIQRVKERMQ